jgi:excisionase family DNA binding protein
MHRIARICEGGAAGCGGGKEFFRAVAFRSELFHRIRWLSSPDQGVEMNNREINRVTASDFDAIARRVMTVQDVSTYLRVHPSTVYRLLKRNELPAFRVGSDWRFNVEAIDRWRSQMEAGAHVLDK